MNEYILDVLFSEDPFIRRNICEKKPFEERLMEVIFLVPGTELRFKGIKALAALTGQQSLLATCCGQTIDVPHPRGEIQDRVRRGNGRARVVVGLPTKVEFQLQ